MGHHGKYCSYIIFNQQTSKKPLNCLKSNFLQSCYH